MYEYEVTVLATGETKIIFGYTYSHALERYGYKVSEVRYEMSHYVD